MKVTAPEGVFLPALGRPVDKGEVVEVSEEIGQSLVEQGWVSERSKAAKRVARKRAAKAKTEPTPEPDPVPEPEPAAAEQED